jgi:hypothetical protein
LSRLDSHQPCQPIDRLLHRASLPLAAEPCPEASRQNR